MSGCNGLCNQGRRVCPHPLDCAQASGERWFNLLMALVLVLAVLSFVTIVWWDAWGAA